MAGTDARPDHPTDPDLAGFDDLLSRSVPGPVAAVYEAAGTTVESVALIQNTWRPGKQLTVRYRISGSGGGLAGRNDVVATIGRIPEGATLVEGPGSMVGLWVVPDDPLLPGLRSALDIPTVARVLSDLGSKDEVIRSRLRAYRPGRRAVVEVQAGPSSIFLKIVPPAEVEDLHEKHRHLSDFIGVPDSLGMSTDLGVVVMRALPGTDLRSALRSGKTPIPDAVTIARMVEDLPEPESRWQARSSIETARSLVELLVRLLPDQSERIVGLAQRLGAEEGSELVPIHGDFHEAQILADGHRPIGLIDVDTFGWGRRGDDAATMLGHLHLLAPGTRSPSRTIELARQLNRHWDASLDPVDLRLRTAAVVFGLATGPYRVNRPNWRVETIGRIDVAERWLESAERIDEKSLIATSGRSNPGPAR